MTRNRLPIPVHNLLSITIRNRLFITTRRFAPNLLNFLCNRREPVRRLADGRHKMKVIIHIQCGSIIYFWNNRKSTFLSCKLTVEVVIKKIFSKVQFSPLAQLTLSLKSQNISNSSLSLDYVFTLLDWTWLTREGNERLQWVSSYHG